MNNYVLINQTEQNTECIFEEKIYIAYILFTNNKPSNDSLHEKPTHGKLLLFFYVYRVFFTVGVTLSFNVISLFQSGKHLPHLPYWGPKWIAPKRIQTKPNKPCK